MKISVNIKFFLFGVLFLLALITADERVFAADTYGPKENVFVTGHCFLGGPAEGYPIDENGEWNEDFYTPATFTVNYSGSDSYGYDSAASLPSVHVGHWGHASGRSAWENAFGMEDTAALPDIYKADYQIDDPADPGYGEWNGGIDSDVYWACFKNCTFSNVNIEMHFPCAFYGCTFNNCSLDSRGGHDVVCYGCTFSGGHTNAYGVDGGVIYTATLKDKVKTGGTSAIHLSHCTVKNDNKYHITRYNGNPVNSFIYACDAKVYLYDGNVFEAISNFDGSEMSVLLADTLGYGLGGVYVAGGSYNNSAGGEAGKGIFIENRGSSDIYLTGGSVSNYKYAVYSTGGTVTHGSKETGLATVISDSAESNIYIKNGQLSAYSDTADGISYNCSTDNRTRYGIYAENSEIDSRMIYSGFSEASLYLDDDSKIRLTGGGTYDSPIGIEADRSAVILSDDAYVNAYETGIAALNSSVGLQDEAAINAKTYGITAEFSEITISGGAICGATVGIDSINSVVAMSAGQIKTEQTDDSIGIKNTDGTLNISGGTISGARIGIYQNGVLRLSGSFSIPYDDGVSVFICKDKRIDVISELISEDYGIKLDLEYDDRPLGRLLVQSYSSDPDTETQMARYFCLAFDELSEAHATGIHTGEPVKAVIRAGTGAEDGFPADNIVISGIFYADYDANVGFDDITPAVPLTSEEFYYMEPYTFKTGEDNIPALYYNDTDISKTYIFKGWATDAAELSDSRIYKEDVTLTKDDDFSFYGIYTYSFDLFVSGNGQTEGEDYVLENIAYDTVLPTGNTDINGSEDDYFKKIYEEDNMTVKNKWVGWSFKKDAEYEDIDIPAGTDTVYTLNSLFGYSTLTDILRMTDEGRAFIEDGRLYLCFYAVWNEYPRISGYDIYIDESEKQQLSEDKILEKAEAYDKEDGKIDSSHIKIRDFDPDGFKYLGDRGASSVILTVSDSCGNESACVVMVYVLKNTPVTSRDGGTESDYVRFIDRENYNKSAAADGGNERYSVWRLCGEYKDKLLKSFLGLEKDEYETVYEFDAQAIKDMAEYVSSNRSSSFIRYFMSDVYNRFCVPAAK